MTSSSRVGWEGSWILSGHFRRGSPPGSKKHSLISYGEGMVCSGISAPGKALLFRVLILFAVFLLMGQAYGARIKDIAEIQGVRKNQLIGYGLVVGLDGSGDGKDAPFTLQSMVGMLEKMGMTVNVENIDVDNVAAVMVTAELPAFARAGTRIDATVSSIGDAESLYGGTLLFTPLKAADGEVYAIAQGPVSIGGFSAGGAKAKIQKNFPTVGRVIGGALVEQEVKTGFAQKKALTLTLRNPDFTTASRVRDSINKALLRPAAYTLDSGTVEIKVPEKYIGNIVELVTLIEGLGVNPDSSSKVVISERTGTVVIGQNVRISTIAIAHGNLSIEVKETADVSQPMPFSEGETKVVPETQLSVKEDKSKLFLVKSGVSISELVRALNALGVSPRDLITIFQTIKAAGALQARLEIM